MKISKGRLMLQRVVFLVIAKLGLISHLAVLYCIWIAQVHSTSSKVLPQPPGNKSLVH